MVIPMGTKIDKCSIYTDRFRRQLVSFSLEQFKSFTERNTYYCSMFASMFSLVKCNVHIKVEYIFISHVLVGGD